MTQRLERPQAGRRSGTPTGQAALGLAALVVAAELGWVALMGFL